MTILSCDEYQQIYQSTGIDVDGRRAWGTKMISNLEGCIKRFISFAKTLPGFKDLPVDDKITIIKGNAITMHAPLCDMMIDLMSSGACSCIIICTLYALW